MTYHRTDRDMGYLWFLAPGFLMFLALVVAPLLVNTAVSFTRWTGVRTPVWIGPANYLKAFGDSIFWASFQNNVYLILVLTTLPTLIGLFLAAFLFDYVARHFGAHVVGFFRAGFYLPQVIPIVVAALAWKWILQPDWGVLNSLLNSIGLDFLAHNWLGDRSTALSSVMAMMIWFQIGYPLTIFMSALQRIDPEVYEAAAIDGVSWIQRLYYVTAPLVRPEIYVVILTTTIYALKTFAPVFAMTKGGPGSATMMPSYFAYKNFFENANVGYGATMATVLTLMIMLLTVVWIRVQARQEQQESR